MTGCGVDLPQHIVFILQPHFSLLAYAGAADVLTTTNLITAEARYRITSLGVGEDKIVSDLGTVINTDGILEAASLTGAHSIIVCGGYRCDLSENKQLSAFLRDAHQQGLLLGGLWNGVIPLAHAGLQQGFECALHLDNHDFAARQFPGLQIVERPVVVDRQRVSAAGAASALELMLTLIQRHDGAATVQAIQHILQSDKVLPNDSQDAIARDAEHQLPASVQTALQLMRNNLDEPLSRDELARCLNKSTRGIERLFQKHLNTSPARYYLELRLDRARHLLMQNTGSIAETSVACGFTSAAHFSRCFSERFGCSPRELRH